MTLCNCPKCSHQDESERMKRRLEKFCKDLIKNGGKGVSRGTVVRAIRDIINPVQIIYDEVVDENGKSVKP